MHVYTMRIVPYGGNTCLHLPQESLDGGAEEDRTPDLRVANATLSQLSYGPTTATSLQWTIDPNKSV